MRSTFFAGRSLIIEGYDTLGFYVGARLFRATTIYGFLILPQDMLKLVNLLLSSQVYLVEP